MKRLLRYFDTLDPALRWVLFLPVGIGASFVVLSVVDMGFAMSAGPYRTTPGVIEGATAAFIAGVTRTLFPAVVSPRPWPVGIIMFTLDLLLRAGPFAYMVMSYEYLRPRAPLAGVVVAAGAVGGCLGLFLVRRFVRSATKAQDTISN
jgi:hypothetical protein